MAATLPQPQYVNPCNDRDGFIVFIYEIIFIMSTWKFPDIDRHLANT